MIEEEGEGGREGTHLGDVYTANRLLLPSLSSTKNVSSEIIREENTLHLHCNTICLLMYGEA